MTKDQLSRLSALRREITRTKKRLAELKNSASTNHQSIQAVQAAENALKRYLDEALTESAALLEYIESINDGSIREIFMLRYYDGIRPWQKIAFMVGEYDESYVRKKHDAFLNKHE